jgi:hypothetical protein
MIADDAVLDLMLRRMRALQAPDLVLGEWGEAFVEDVCGRMPADITDRQAAWVNLLCWRQRDAIPAELVPASEPPQPGKRQGAEWGRRRW